MVSRRTADSPLHGGRAPAWLFRRMTALAGEIVRLLVLEYGPEEVLRRLADPWWFQAFGCVLGFDWHASGLTTVTCGALKEAYRRLGEDFAVVVAGGKGRASRKTPEEITEACMRSGADGERLVGISRLTAKVDSAAVQDGYQLYHHTFFFLSEEKWCVVQQGMNEEAGFARRYHWLSETVEDFTCEPHEGIAGGEKRGTVLNLVAREGAENREAQVSLTRLPPEELEKLIGPEFVLPRHHRLSVAPLRGERLRKAARKLHEAGAADFTSLLRIEGVGAKTLRSLALTAEIVYGKPPSFRDPALFSYAHGGKDGIPFPVDRETYDRNVEILRQAVEKARIGHYEKVRALRRMARLTEKT